MTFEIRLQRDPPLTTPQDLRNDVNLQKVASAVKAAYMKKQVPTDTSAVKAEIELTFPSVSLASGVVYRQYTDAVTGETYWCCTLDDTLTVTIAGEDPILVELMKTELVP